MDFDKLLGSDFAYIFAVYVYIVGGHSLNLHSGKYVFHFLRAESEV